jgi:hypothetical protein
MKKEYGKKVDKKVTIGAHFEISIPETWFSEEELDDWDDDIDDVGDNFEEEIGVKVSEDVGVFDYNENYSDEDEDEAQYARGGW